MRLADARQSIYSLVKHARGAPSHAGSAGSAIRLEAFVARCEADALLHSPPRPKRRRRAADSPTTTSTATPSSSSPPQPPHHPADACTALYNTGLLLSAVKRRGYAHELSFFELSVRRSFLSLANLLLPVAAGGLQTAAATRPRVRRDIWVEVRDALQDLRFDTHLKLLHVTPGGKCATAKGITPAAGSLCQIDGRPVSGIAEYRTALRCRKLNDRIRLGFTPHRGTPPTSASKELSLALWAAATVLPQDAVSATGGQDIPQDLQQEPLFGSLPEREQLRRVGIGLRYLVLRAYSTSAMGTSSDPDDVLLALWSCARLRVPQGEAAWLVTLAHHHAAVHGGGTAMPDEALPRLARLLRCAVSYGMPGEDLADAFAAAGRGLSGRRSPLPMRHHASLVWSAASSRVADPILLNALAGYVVRQPGSPRQTLADFISKATPSGGPAAQLRYLNPNSDAGVEPGGSGVECVRSALRGGGGGGEAALSRALRCARYISATLWSFAVLDCAAAAEALWSHAGQLRGETVRVLSEGGNGGTLLRALRRASPWAHFVAAGVWFSGSPVGLPSGAPLRGVPRWLSREALLLAEGVPGTGRLDFTTRCLFGVVWAGQAPPADPSTAPALFGAFAAAVTQRFAPPAPPRGPTAEEVVLILRGIMALSLHHRRPQTDEPPVEPPGHFLPWLYDGPIVASLGGMEGGGAMRVTVKQMVQFGWCAATLQVRSSAFFEAVTRRVVEGDLEGVLLPIDAIQLLGSLAMLEARIHPRLEEALCGVVQEQMQDTNTADMSMLLSAASELRVVSKDFLDACVYRLYEIGSHVTPAQAHSLLASFASLRIDGAAASLIESFRQSAFNPGVQGSSLELLYFSQKGRSVGMSARQK